MKDKVILLTGSTGFVGSYLLEKLQHLPGCRVISAVRYHKECSGVFKQVITGDMNGSTDYSAALINVDVVIHTAAQIQSAEDDVSNTLSIYQRVNVEATLNLAQQAADANVKRFIFLSSAKVNGATTTGLSPFTEDLASKPQCLYGLSKSEAEEGLRLLAQETGLEVVIIRPPLVYGPGVKANFLSLMKLSATSFPLPFACINNRRSMLYLGNLVDFIFCCVDHPCAANETFLVSDGEDLSLCDLVNNIRVAMERSPNLVPLPVWLFKLAGKLAGKCEMVDRLVGDLQVDGSKARILLDWIPPYSVEQGIRETVAHYMRKDV